MTGRGTLAAALVAACCLAVAVSASAADLSDREQRQREGLWLTSESRMKARDGNKPSFEELPAEIRAAKGVRELQANGLARRSILPHNSGGIDFYEFDFVGSVDFYWNARKPTVRPGPILKLC